MTSYSQFSNQSKDAVGKNGKIKITVQKIKKGERIFEKQKVTKVAKQRGALLSISDNGCGIPDEFKEKIFDPFFTTKEATGGSGFGLYNAKLFIEDHNGSIDFISEKNKGTTFYIFVPLAVIEENDSIKSEKNTIKKANKKFLKSNG